MSSSISGYHCKLKIYLIKNTIFCYLDSFAYEFLGKTYGLITYKYPEDKQPDTKVTKIEKKLLVI